MRIIYNANLPVITKIESSLLTNLEIKNNYRQINIKNFIELEKDNQQLINLINSCPFNNDRKKILIDIKIREYIKGEYTCFNKEFHLDGRSVIKKRDSLEDNRYYICILEGPGTEFIQHPFGINYDTNLNLNQVDVLKNYNLDRMLVYKLPLKVWNSYGEFHWHCGRYINKDCKRVFIKITETNYIKELRYK